MVSAPARREAAQFAVGRGLSQRRACALVKVARSALRYQSRMPSKDAAVLARMAQLARQYPRYGYRRVQVFLERDGYRMSPAKMHRLWRLGGQGHQIPRKRSRRRISEARPRPLPSTGPGQVWAYDFVHDRCANGQKLKCLTIVDEFTRESLAIDVAGSIRGERVVRVLSRLVSLHGAPRHLRSDNGPEFVSTAVLTWLTAAGIRTAHIEPGKPWQNGSNESFNGKFRDECLSVEWFRSRAEATVLIEAWRKHYNHVRPHSSLDYRTPRAFRRLFDEPLQSDTLVVQADAALHALPLEAPIVKGLPGPTGLRRHTIDHEKRSTAFGKEANPNTEVTLK